MSLNKVQKMVRGVRGREPPTGETDLKSWNAFEEEVSLIWKNARDYNEDGSDLYNLSIEFEVCILRLDIVSLMLTIVGTVQAETCCGEGEGRRASATEAQT
jgi:hypothetical protein